MGLTLCLADLPQTVEVALDGQTVEEVALIIEEGILKRAEKLGEYEGEPPLVIVANIYTVFSGVGYNAGFYISKMETR